VRRTTLDRLFENQQILHVARRLADTLEALDRRIPASITTRRGMLMALAQAGFDALGDDGDGLDGDAAAEFAVSGTCGVPVRFLVDALARARDRAKRTGRRKAFLVAGLRAYVVFLRENGKWNHAPERPARLLARLEADVQLNARRLDAGLRSGPQTSFIADAIRDLASARRELRERRRRRALDACFETTDSPYEPRNLSSRVSECSHARFQLWRS